MLREFTAYAVLWFGAIWASGAFAQPELASTREEHTMRIQFETSTEKNSWRAVNDGVMGGRSSGRPTFENGRMIFSGETNTTGGGFSSIRIPIERGSLKGVSGLMMRIKSDGRTYKILLRTDAVVRGRQISFQAPIPETKKGDWADVFVPFEKIRASIFGQPIEGVEFIAADATSLGIIIADGKDGSFRLEVDWLEASLNPQFY